MVLNKMSFTPVNGASRPRETAFAPVNGASRCAGRHLPDKTGPRVAREAICPTKRGLALCGEPFARQNGASRIAERHLPDKTGPREVAECHLPDKMGPRASRKAICPTKRGLATLRNAICPTKRGLATPRTAKPRLISYISRLGSLDCPPRQASRRSPSMGRGACRHCRPRRDRGRQSLRQKQHHLH